MGKHTTTSVQNWLDETDFTKRLQFKPVVRSSTRKKQSLKARARWQDAEQRSHLEAKRREQHTDLTRQKLREANRRQFSDPQAILNHSKKSLSLWQDPEYRARQMAVRAKNKLKHTQAVRDSKKPRWVTPIVTPYGQFPSKSQAVIELTRITGRRWHGATISRWVDEGRPGWRRLPRCMSSK